MHLNGRIGSISHTISTSMECFPVIEKVRDNILKIEILVVLKILPGITAWEKQVAEGNGEWVKEMKVVKRHKPSVIK